MHVCHIFAQFEMPFVAIYNWLEIYEFLELLAGNIVVDTFGGQIRSLFPGEVGGWCGQNLPSTEFPARLDPQTQGEPLELL